MNLVEITKEIMSLDLDQAGIDKLYKVLKAKSRLVHDQQKAVIKVSLHNGTRVRILRIRPKSLEGLEGTVVAIRRERVDIQLAEELDTWHPGYKHVYGGKVTGIPVSCLELL